MKKYTVYIEQTSAQVIEVMASDPYVAARKAKKTAPKETECLITCVEWDTGNNADQKRRLHEDDLDSVNY